MAKGVFRRAPFEMTVKDCTLAEIAERSADNEKGRPAYQVAVKIQRDRIRVFNNRLDGGGALLCGRVTTVPAGLLIRGHVYFILRVIPVGSVLFVAFWGTGLGIDLLMQASHGRTSGWAFGAMFIVMGIVSLGALAWMRRAARGMRVRDEAGLRARLEEILGPQ